MRDQQEMGGQGEEGADSEGGWGSGGGVNGIRMMTVGRVGELEGGAVGGG